MKGALIIAYFICVFFFANSAGQAGDFSAVANAYGDYFAQKNKVLSPAIDLFGTTKVAQSYGWGISTNYYNLTVAPTNVTYDSKTRNNVTYENNSDTPQNDTFETTVSTTDTYTFTVTNSFQQSSSYTVGLNVNLVFDIISFGLNQGSGTTGTVSFASTQGGNITQSKEYKISQQITVPPHQKMNVYVVVDEALFKTTFIAYIRISGQVFFNFDPAISLVASQGSHHYWGITPGEIVSLVSAIQPSLTANFRVDGNDAFYVSKGYLVGSYGFNATADTTPV